MKRRRAVFLFVALALGFGSSAGALPDFFEIETGYVSGMALGGDVPVWAYLGLPYAAPPTGARRFKPPERPEPVPALFEAIEYGPICPQTPYPEGSIFTQPEAEQFEDCLYLNVWSGAIEASEKRPVMVWIHGGGYTRGAGSLPYYDGAALARRGAVVVTFNYRLGVLGFLAHPALSSESEQGSSGNYAILDQIAALQWVQRNIAQFGGDPDNVTIFGESAGGGSVSFLLGSPLARGLFHRAIAQSGGHFRRPMPLLKKPRGELPSGEGAGAVLASSLGHENASAETLRHLPVRDLLGASLTVGPVVDGWVFPEDVAETFAASRQIAVPVLVGFNDDEATAFVRRPETEEAFVQAVRERFGASVSAEAVMGAYPDHDRQDVFLAAYRDHGYGCPAQRLAASSSPAYAYRFTRVGAGPVGERLGAFHGSEIPYVFGNLDTLWSDPVVTDEHLSDAMSRYWLNFARSGNPNGEGLTEWPSYSAENGSYLELGDAIVARRDLVGAACELFDRSR